LPVSLFLAKQEVMNVFTPGDHGSTFGGNPLAAAVGLEALKILEADHLAERAATLGDYFLQQLQKIKSPSIKEIRGKGLFIGIEFDPMKVKARDICLKLLNRGILSKETHHVVMRLAPPLIISKEQLDWAVEVIADVVSEIV
jgi:ornithine--oxo-acid transaminase